MKITKLRIQNLRSFKDVTLPLTAYTCLVGPNGSGKSTALLALNILFRETSGPQTDCCNLQEEDFYCRKTDEAIKITATFTDLTPAEHQALKDYVRHAQLIISAEAKWNPVSKTASVTQFGERLSFPAFSEYYDAEHAGATAAELKQIFSSLRERYPEISKATSGPARTQALDEYAAAHLGECKPRPSEDQFYGFQGTNKLAPFIQWVYVPAVKDAATEISESKHAALGKLLARTVRRTIDFKALSEDLRQKAQVEYQQMLNSKQNALDGVSQKLTARIREWAHPDAALSLQWRNDPQKSVSLADPIAEILAAEGDLFKGSINRFGHGFQRSYLMALLQELSETVEGDEPRLILGCEEPELYQHPPQARHLVSVFENLSKANAQVLVCTHSPHFVSAREFESVRIIKKERKTGAAKAISATLKDVDADIATATGRKLAQSEEGIRAKIFSSLQIELNELFFSNICILVEGAEDRGFISTHLHLLGLWDDFRKLGCHIIPVNSKSKLLRPCAIARRFGIPVFAIFDADADKYTKPEEKDKRDMHERDNRAILTLYGYGKLAPFPNAHITEKDLIMWTSDIGAVFRDEITEKAYRQHYNEVNAAFGHVGDLHKNELAIADFVERAWQDGKRSPSLVSACESILKYARAHS